MRQKDVRVVRELVMSFLEVFKGVIRRAFNELSGVMRYVINCNIKN